VAGVVERPGGQRGQRSLRGRWRAHGRQPGPERSRCANSGHGHRDDFSAPAIYDAGSINHTHGNCNANRDHYCYADGIRHA